MEDERKLVDVMPDVLAEIHEMRKGIDKSNNRLEKVEKGVEKLEKQMMLNNKAIGELRLSVMRLADRDRMFMDYDRRIRKIESSLLRNNLL